MAIYHLSAKTISRSDGRSATGAAAYRSGECITDERSGQTFDYSRKQGIDHTEILVPENAPEWTSQRARLWNAVEHSEKRKDSQLCREIEIALPAELTPQEQKTLVRGFAQKQFVDIGMIADIAIHHAADSNPHAHILLTMRDIGEHGFGQKNRTWNDKQMLENWREAWELHANAALEKAGHAVRIDHRTLEAQGIERLPQIHLGPKVPEMERRGIVTEIGSQAIAIDEHNQTLSELTAELETTHERHPENPPGQRPGTNRASPRTLGAEHGQPGRADADQHQEHGTRQLPASPRMEHAAGERRPASAERSGAGHRPHPDLAASHGQTASDHRAPATPAGPPLLASGRDDGAGCHPRSGAFDRVLALAGAAPAGAEHARPQSPGRIPQARDSGDAAAQVDAPDRSYLAARRQLDAMGAPHFEVGIRDRQGQMLIRTWSRDQVLQSLPWLKRENARGADVFVRPAPADGEKSAGLVLVDDLDRGQLARMRELRLAPACVTETSPGNFQAWVRVSPSPIVSEAATEASRRLAEHFGGDLNSADWRHFGRLAGLINAKPCHQDRNGRSPYVLAHECSGQSAEAGKQLLAHVGEVLANRAAHAEQKRRVGAVFKPVERLKSSEATDAYLYGLKALYARFGASMDLSRADYILGIDLARRGFTAKQIGETLEQCSPELPVRKAGHEGDYVQRTVAAVLQAPAVREHQQQAQERQRQRPRDHDHGMSR